MDLARMRLDYSEHGIDENELKDDPLEQWRAWLQDAVEAEVIEPNAMVVATVEDGQPRTRALLAKGVAPDGIDFYTNYHSQKGQALGDSGPVSATFVWMELQRQVTFLGEATKVPEADSDTYFALRPREAQLGAWTSEQSSEIESRDVLKRRFAEFDSRFADEVPRPPHWGGYRILPREVEFWQGRPNRLHDRFRYLKTDQGWTRQRLSP